MIKLLIGKRNCLTVVGDDDQSIYSWRGAKPQNISLLQKDFPALKVIKLEQNYRSTKNILNTANALISNNKHIFKKNLFSLLGYGSIPKVMVLQNEDHEAEKVVKELIYHNFINKSSYSDYAILYRGNYQSRLFEKILIQNRIPYYISGGTSFFLRPEIKYLLAYLRILINQDDDSAFLRIINKPRRDIGAITLSKLSSWANQRNKSLFSASLELGFLQKLSARSLESIKYFTSFINNFASQAERDPLKAIEKLIKTIDYESWLYEISSNSKIAKTRINNVIQMYSWIKKMLNGSESNKPMTLDQILIHFTLKDITEKDNNGKNNQVQLMTLHASKGLEFPYVFLVGMEEGILPHESSINEDKIEEERRLVYVGITRAQKELTFTLCRYRNKYGNIIKTKPSRFLLELPQDNLMWNKKNKLVDFGNTINNGKRHIDNIRNQLLKSNIK